jgi:hypothetical protein
MNPSNSQRKLSTPLTLFPRNLTARADYVVPGNPMSSRPESGVDNAHPGLEMDPRHIDRTFFEGLRFDFQYRFGARLSKVLNEAVLSPLSLSAAERASLMQEPSAYFIWFIEGHFGDQPEQAQRFDAMPVGGPDQRVNSDGYLVQRAVRDLERAGPDGQSYPLVVALGIMPPEEPTHAGAWRQARDAAQATMAKREPTLGRSTDGTLQWLILVGQRAAYFTEEGVIALFDEGQALEPGVLTQSLCSPWQWDFADCGCYYWAASRPDIVTSQAGDSTTLNYQRDLTGRAPDSLLNWEGWMAHTMTLPQMITFWPRLPLVVNDREQPDGPLVLTAPLGALVAPVLSYAQIIEQLTYLASVEHALTVQYLYAYYSLTPAGMLSSGFSPLEDDLLASVGKDILTVALDEMQHLQWVNQALVAMGEPPTLARASEYGRAPASSIATHATEPFQLLPLTLDALDTFIRIERPQPLSATPDFATSLYIHVLDSLQRLDSNDTAAFPPGPDAHPRLLELIKRLIDEGDLHAQRLALIQQALRQFRPWRSEPWLRVTTGAVCATDQALRKLQLDGNRLYAKLLADLMAAFAQRPGLDVPKQTSPAASAMRDLALVAQQLAAQGFGLLFELPPTPLAAAA